MRLELERGCQIQPNIKLRPDLSQYLIRLGSFDPTRPDPTWPDLTPVFDKTSIYVFKHLSVTCTDLWPESPPDLTWPDRNHQWPGDPDNRFQLWTTILTQVAWCCRCYVVITMTLQCRPRWLALSCQCNDVVLRCWCDTFWRRLQ